MFVYVTVWYEENGQDVQQSCFLPGIPHKGDEVVLGIGTGNDIEGTVTEVAYIAQTASPVPLESYVTVFIDVNKRRKLHA